MNAPDARIVKILSSSAVDGPGNRAVVFFQGCDFNCAYCHNPETRDALSPDARRMPVEAVLSLIRRYASFISGVTLSGGECGLQLDFITELVVRLRGEGLSCLIDTNGSTDYSTCRALVSAAEGFILDVKAWNDSEHKRLTGADNSAVLRNLDYLASRKALHEVRTVIAPGLFSVDETVSKTAKRIAAFSGGIRYKLIRFRPHGVRGEWRHISVPSGAEMKRLAALATQAGAANVIIV